MKLTSVMVILFMFGSVGCVINATDSTQDPLLPSNDPELTTGEQPVFKSFPSGAVVEFSQQFGQPMEAWEVSVQMNETYLNYSRFPYGTPSYKGQAAQVCTAVVGLNKYVGVSENTIRLKKAMMVVTMVQTRSNPIRINCTTYEAMFAKDPRTTSLEKVFDSL